MKNDLSFDEWASMYGCDNCRKPSEERWWCPMCKRAWCIDMCNADEDRKIIDNIGENDGDD
jgi:hypothetical protein